MLEVEQVKRRIIQAGRKAVDELIKIAEEPILSEKGMMIVNGEDVSLNSEDIAADKLKNAAATKKLAIFDAFEILARIEAEQNILDEVIPEKKETFTGFAERKAKK